MSTSRSATLRRAVTLLAAATAGGCHLFGGSCLDDPPTSCPPTPPTYAQVEPVLAHACVLCHEAEGQVRTIPLDTYDAVYARRDAAEKLVSTCAMPKDGVVLTDDERRALLTWFVCGAPR
jgi:uncharacterized membrane protein